ncbi:hypothetical protein HMSSN036_23680 [Paenibacillus macerans]|nr:hypothetical protein HMSSN036_23680 [Paenibacillus macerans]
MRVIKTTLEDFEVRKQVRYITVTSSSSCLVAVNKDCKPLYEAIMVSDTRASFESSYLSELEEFLEVKELTGLSADPYLMIPKILWVRNNHLQIYEKTYKFLSPNDYFIAKLSGLFITDEFNAQKYHYSIDQRLYPIELLDKNWCIVKFISRGCIPWRGYR